MVRPVASLAAAVALGALGLSAELAAQEGEPPPDLGHELRGVLGDTALFEPAGGGKQLLRRAGETIGDFRIVRIGPRSVDLEKDGRTWEVRVQVLPGAEIRPGAPPYPHRATPEFETARRALETWRVSLRASGEPVGEVVRRLLLELGVNVEWTERATRIATEREEGATFSTGPIPLGDALRLLLAPRGLAATATAAGITIHAAGEEIPEEAASRVLRGLEKARELVRSEGPRRPAAARVLERLATARVDLDAAGRSLAEVLAWLGSQAELEIVLDPSVRTWADSAGGVPLDDRFEDVPLEEALLAVLEPRGLLFEPSEEGLVVRFVPGSGSSAAGRERSGAEARLAAAAVPPALAGWTLPALLERLARAAGVPLRFAAPVRATEVLQVSLAPGSSIAWNLDQLLAGSGLAARLVDGVLIVGPPEFFDTPVPPPPGSGLAAAVDVTLERATFLEAVNGIGEAAGLEMAVDLSALDLSRDRRYDARLVGTAASALESVLGPLGLGYTLRGRTVQIHPLRDHPRLGAGDEPERPDPLAGRAVDVSVERDTLLETLNEIAHSGRFTLQVDVPVLDAYKDRRYTVTLRGPASRVLADFLAGEGLAYTVEAGTVRVHLYDAGPAGAGRMGTFVDASFEEASFLEVVNGLASRAGVQAVVDEAALEVLEERRLTRFSPRFSGVPVGSALASFLGPLGLGFEGRDGIVHVFAIPPPGADEREFGRLGATPVPPELVGLRLEAVLADLSALTAIEFVLTAEGAALYAAAGTPLLASGLGTGPLEEALRRALLPLGLETSPDGERILVVPAGLSGEGPSGDPLSSRVDLDLSGLSLRDALGRLADPAGLFLVVDPEIEEALALEEPPGQRYVEVPLGEALEDLLEAVQGAYAVRDRRLFLFPKPLEPDEARRTRNRLEGTVDLAAVERPLAEVLEEIAAQTGLEVRLDPAALRAVAERGEDAVTIRIAATTLSTALREVLEPRGLDWFAGDGFLFVSTPESVHAARVERARREVAGQEREREADSALSGRHEFQFRRTPWSDFVAGLERATGLPVVSDPAAWAAHPEIDLAGSMTLGEALERIEREHRIRGLLLDGVLYLMSRP